MLGRRARQEQDLGRAIGAFAEELEPLDLGRLFARTDLEHHQGPLRQPAAGAEPGQRLVAEALAIGRVEKGEVEGRAVGGRLLPKVGGVAAMDARRAEEAERLDIVADRAARLRVRLNEQAPGRAARDLSVAMPSSHGRHRGAS